MKPVVITSGEPAGIGPELVALLAEADCDLKPACPVVILGDVDLLNNRAHQAEIHPLWAQVQSIEEALMPGYYLLHEPLMANCKVGQPDSANAQYVLALLDRAVAYCSEGKASAMVTAPIQKSAISPVWRGFQGHTEYLAEKTQTKRVVMMLQGGGLRVALATTHLPLKEVPTALNQEMLGETLEILLKDLREKYRIERPRILVTGLNPHAGESGTMGVEDEQIIAPVIHRLRDLGELVSGPYPADTLFQPKYLQNADAVLAMYHDQGLPVLKFASFGQGINITLGLPIVRTSVDHGTALDLAGKRNMNPGSLKEALKLAIALGSTA